jgi:hypothetical protein
MKNREERLCQAGQPEPGPEAMWPLCLGIPNPVHIPLPLSRS